MAKAINTSINQSLIALEQELNKEISKLQSKGNKAEVEEAIQEHMLYAYPNVSYALKADGSIAILSFNKL